MKPVMTRELASKPKAISENPIEISQSTNHRFLKNSQIPEIDASAIHVPLLLNLTYYPDSLEDTTDSQTNGLNSKEVF